MIVPGAYRAPSVMHRIFFNLAIGNGTKDSKDQSDRSKSAHNAITQINSGCDLDYRDNFYDQHVPLKGYRVSTRALYGGWPTRILCKDGHDLDHPQHAARIGYSLIPQRLQPGQDVLVLLHGPTSP